MLKMAIPIRLAPRVNSGIRETGSRSRAASRRVVEIENHSGEALRLFLGDPVAAIGGELAAYIVN